MTHLDLFSGIGGFALAAQTVWGSDYHCVGFCEIDPFCQQVLRKNFEGVNIYGDIRGLTAERLAADTESGRWGGRGGQPLYQSGEERTAELGENVHGSLDGQVPTVDLLTGGFPCQPFSTAGKRKGAQDDRYLWPEMLRVIREVKPRWVIGENVAGIVEMALGQVCADLEGLDYEVQCFVIPACAVNAPHRRDRVWIVGHLANSAGLRCDSELYQGQGIQPGNVPCGEIGTSVESQESDSDAEVNAVGAGLRESEQEGERGQRFGDTDCTPANPTGSRQSEEGGQIRPDNGKVLPENRERLWDVSDPADCPSSDPCGKGLEGCEETRDAGSRGETSEQRLGEFPESRAFPDWTRDWREVAALTCVHRMDDGLSRRVVRFSDGSTISESKWQQEALKAYGNSIVPQVAMEIMRAIKEIDP